MQIIVHRINTIEGLKKVPTQYGVEIDVRGYGGKILLNHDPIDDPSKYGVFLVVGETLTKIIEKPKEFVGNMTNIGLYKFTPDIWKALDHIQLSPRGEYELTDAISLLAQHEKVKVLRLKNYWLDLGCKEDIPKVEEFIKKLE